jgi:putative toxin-antitoxin system antitoxin component (TIGR02293 family)
LTAPQLPVSRIVPVVAHAVAVFGDEHKASHWFSTPVAFLENRAPSELLNSTEGIQRVEEILTRIEHNIFSSWRLPSIGFAAGSMRMKLR